MNSSVSARLNSDLLEEKYALWCEDPRSVEGTWSSFFEGFELGVSQAKAKGGQAGETAAQATPGLSGADLEFHGKVVGLVYNYRTLGHTQAQINPLDENPEVNPRLSLREYNFTEAEMEREASNPFFFRGAKMKLRDMVAALKATYSGKIGFEFMHIHNTTVRHWVRERIEQHGSKGAEKTADLQVKSLRWLLEAETFENFLAKKFLGEKRFSLEGGEGTMVLLNALLKTARRGACSRSRWAWITAEG